VRKRSAALSAAERSLPWAVDGVVAGPTVEKSAAAAVSDALETSGPPDVGASKGVEEGARLDQPRSSNGPPGAEGRADGASKGVVQLDAAAVAVGCGGGGGAGGCMLPRTWSLSLVPPLPYVAGGWQLCRVASDEADALDAPKACCSARTCGDAAGSSLLLQVGLLPLDEPKISSRRSVPPWLARQDPVLVR